MDCSGPEKGVEPIRCEKCGVTRGVMYDYLIKRWLCHLCWVRTPMPWPPKRP